MTDALTAPVAARQEEAANRERVRDAGRTLLVGAALGLLGQLLFYGLGLGINVLFFVAALLLAGLRLRRGTRLALADTWLAPAALILAAFVALRGDPVLAAIDTAAAVGLAGAALIGMAGRSVLRRTATGMALLAGRLLLAAASLAAVVAVDARPELPRAGGQRRRLAGVGPVLRGVLIALPLVLVFTALFASADAIFAQLVGDLLRVELDLGELPGRLAVAFVVGWLVTGALAFAVASAGGRDDAEPRLPRFLGTVEAATVLVILDVLFAGFVVLQAPYLFGGLDTLAATGLTYADYARRGFFELCGVAFLVGGVVVSAEAVVRRRSRIYVGAIAALVALTLVVIASAALRLGLYQHAYGWTQLRFYVAATIAWLALGAVLALVSVLTDRARWLPHALLVAALAVGLAINVIGPVHFIAGENVARAVDPSLVAPEGESGLDEYYLGRLGPDAIEPLVQALPHLPDTERGAVERLLRSWRAELVADGPDSWQEWNLGRSRARDVLADPVTR